MSVNWGFLGAGFVASRGLAPAVHQANGADLYAVASRDEKRSATLEPEKVHATYDDLLADDQVDAVYISLSNVQHLEWVTKSLDAGKHVLCEKPLGLNASQNLEMFDCASRNGRLLVEAVWNRWHPRFQRLVEVVNHGVIGDLEHIETAFTFTSETTDNYRFDPAMEVEPCSTSAAIRLTSGSPSPAVQPMFESVNSLESSDRRVSTSRPMSPCASMTQSRLTRSVPSRCPASSRSSFEDPRGW